jgi:hypothetical protein
MTQNELLYNAAMALVACAKFIRPVDDDFVQTMLDKADEYTSKIVIDEGIEKEVDELEREIRKEL